MLREFQPLAREAVEMRRRRVAPMEGDIRPAKILGHDEYDVRLWLRRGSGFNLRPDGRHGEEERQGEERFHALAVILANKTETAMIFPRAENLPRRPISGSVRLSMVLGEIPRD